MMNNAFCVLYRHRHVLFATTRTEVQARYAGTTLGLVWTVLYPLLFLGLYAVVYILILKVRVGELAPMNYVLLIFSGLVPFLGFAEALGTGVSAVTANKSLVKNTLFPLELIPARNVLAATFTLTVGLVLLHIVIWFVDGFHVTQLFTPIIIVLQLMFTMGIIWMLSALTVFFKDLSQLVGVIVLLLMLISPIAYTNDMIPAEIRSLMFANPLYFMIELYRGAIIEHVIYWRVVFGFFLVSCSSFLIGFWFFSRLKPLLADHV
jgi:lipopolysaccharide transport system permease protein